MIIDLFQLSRLRAEQGRSGGPYLEFLRVPSLSLGLYVLPAGAMDSQQPHTEDEAYYVIGGRGRVQIGDTDQAVEPAHSSNFLTPSSARSDWRYRPGG